MRTGGEYSRLSRAGDHARDEQTLAIVEQTRAHEPEFLGLTEAEARSLADKLGLPLVVIAPGDPITFDFLPRRMTVVADAGRIVEAFAG